MAASSANFSISADVVLNLKNIQKQLDSMKFNIGGKEVAATAGAMGNLSKATTSAGNAVNATQLSFQAANAIFRKSIDVISSMIDQVYELDGAITEFKKVSDLQGASLDRYVSKLTNMGGQVARTGKPWCLTRNVRIVNVH